MLFSHLSAKNPTRPDVTSFYQFPRFLARTTKQTLSLQVSFQWNLFILHQTVIVSPVGKKYKLRENSFLRKHDHQPPKYRSLSRLVQMFTNDPIKRIRYGTMKWIDKLITVEKRSLPISILSHRFINSTSLLLRHYLIHFHESSSSILPQGGPTSGLWYRVSRVSFG